MFIVFLFIASLSITAGFTDDIRIGILLRNNDERAEKIIDNVIWRTLSNGPQTIPYTIIKEKATANNAFQYHKTACKLIANRAGVFLTSSEASYFPIITEFSNDYNISIVSPALVEAPDDPRAPDLMTQFAVGIQPSTIRPMLDAIRDLEWREIVYIYDRDDGPEKLQVMFRVGYAALHLKLLGITRVKSAKEANEFLRKIDGLGKQRTYDVVLDTDSTLAQDILQLHVHDIVVGKKNFNFLLSSHTLPSFWTLHEFGTLRIFGFLAVPINSHPMHEEEDLLRLFGHRVLNENSNLTVSDYYFHDSSAFLAEAVKAVWNRRSRHTPSVHRKQVPDPHQPDCTPHGLIDTRIANELKKVTLDDGFTGKIQFSSVNGRRVNFNLNLVESIPHGFRNVGVWTDRGKFGGIRRVPDTHVPKPETLPQISGKNVLRVTSVISPPYMVLREVQEGIELTGNDRYEGYCKDILEILSKMLQIDYQIYLVEDGAYGKFDNSRQRWSGMIGELIQGKADLAVADLAVTARRQRVVDFTDPLDTVSFSLILKNPASIRASSSMFFAFNAFSGKVWTCILFSAIIFIALFHVITKFTGAPDSIEAASGIWGRKNGLTINIWFALGSSMLQNNGVFPRSISSRMLTGAWWFSTLIFTCFLIASITSQLRVKDSGIDRNPQLSQLKTLSVESILLESLTRGWPKVGLRSNHPIDRFIRDSNLPLYKRYSQYLNENPDLLFSNPQDGVKRVRESNGGFILMAESTEGYYESEREPCDLLTVQDTFILGAYGIAMSPLMDSSLKMNITRAVKQLQDDGHLGPLHRKWWTESSQCKKGIVQETSFGTLHAISGFLCVILAGIALLLIIFGIQFTRKIQDKESRIHQLTFEDMNLDNQLPTPPPELLNQPTPILELPEIHNEALNTTQDSETFKDFFQRMRGGH